MKYPFKILDKKKFLICFFIAFLVNLCIYIMPILLALLTSQPFTLRKLVWLIISTIVIKFLFLFFNHIWCTWVDNYLISYTKKLQIAYFKRITKMKLQKLNEIHNGFLKKQIDILSDEMLHFLDAVLSTVNGFTISIAIFLLTVFLQSISLFFICVGFLVVIIIISLFISKIYIPKEEIYNETYSNYNGSYVDFLQNVKTVKKMDAVDYSIHKMNTKFNDIKIPLKKRNFCSSLLSNGISFLVYIMYAFLLIQLYFQMKSGIDVLPFVIFYTTIFNNLSIELRDFSSLIRYFNNVKAASNQIERLLGTELEELKKEEWKTIELHDIHYKYPKAEMEIVIPSFLLHRNDFVSIVGESGQGKSTFLNILTGYLEISPDNYLMDQKPFQGILDVSYISQENDLFDLSLYDNLTLGKDVSMDFLNKLLVDAGLKSYIEKLNHGLDTMVGERGLKLSMGQKQRINLLRGIILDKDIYILDEPTSNLDEETENLIIKLIETYLKNKTVLIVTHRTNVKNLCKTFYIFKNNILQKEKDVLSLNNRDNRDKGSSLA